jgi:hypothetical protein
MTRARKLSIERSKTSDKNDAWRCFPMKTYPDLYELLRCEAEARTLFASLPLYVRTAINDRPDGINSIASLRDYAENMTRND